MVHAGLLVQQVHYKIDYASHQVARSGWPSLSRIYCSVILKVTGAKEDIYKKHFLTSKALALLLTNACLMIQTTEKRDFVLTTAQLTLIFLLTGLCANQTQQKRPMVLLK